MSARWKQAVLVCVFLSLSVGVISAAMAVFATPRASAGTGCAQNAGTAVVTLDQAAGTPTTLSQDGSNNLLINGAACGAGFPTEVDFVVTNGAPAQSVILDQTGAGGVFPCTATIGGSMRASDTVTVQAATSENPVIGDTTNGTGVDLDGCEAAGTFIGLGNWRLIGGSSTTVLSAAGEAGVMSGLDVRAVLEPGAGSETLVSGAATDAIDFSDVPTSGATGLLVNISGAPATGMVANRTAVAGSSTYTFTAGSGGFNQYAGATTGFTTFLAPGTPGSTFIGQGSGDVLDLGTVPTGTRIDASTNQVSGTDFGGTDTFTGFGTILGSASGHTTFAGSSSPVTFVGRSGSNTFVAGTGSETFHDSGSADTIDFSALTTPLTVNTSGNPIGPAASGTAVAGSSTYTFVALSHPLTFNGASANSTFDAGTAADTLNGVSGETNALSFSDTTGSALHVCAAAASGCSAGQAVLGSTQESFANIADFTGLAGGNTTFVSAGVGGQSFTGIGSGNVLDESAAPSGATVDASTTPGSVSALTGGGSDSFSGISSFVGSAAGGTAFEPGSSSASFANPSSAADSVNFSDASTNSSSPLVVNVSGAPVSGAANKTATEGAATYTFTSGGFDDFTGATSGFTTFLAGASGGDTFTGHGLGNVLDLGAAGTGIRIDVSTGVVSELASGGTDAFSGLSTLLGSGQGHTIFAGGSAAATFTGRSGNNTFIAGSGNETFQDSTSAGDALDFSKLTSSLTLNVSGVGASASNDSAITQAATYTFTSLTGPLTFTGASANTTFDAGSQADTFNGVAAASNTLSFLDASGSELSVCLAGVPGCPAANEAQLDSSIEPFANITKFVGLPTGHTDFVANGTGGYTFAGTSSSNLLDLSAALTAVVDTASDTVTGLSGSGSDTFSGIETFAINLHISSSAPTGAEVGQTYTPAVVGTGSPAPFLITADPLTTSVCSVSGGTVEFIHSGSCTIDVNQAAGGAFEASSQKTQTIVVGPAGTTTSVSVASTTLTATVRSTASATSVPTGTVAFTVGGVAVGSSMLNDHGVATLAVSVPSGSTRTVVATYSPADGDFTESAGSVARQDPTITSHVTSAHAKTKYGWYRSKVTVSFTCHATSASLAGGCPAAVTLSKKGAGQSVSRTVSATDGGAATAVVKGINIDLSKPTVKLTGVKSGHTYSTAPTIKVTAKDALSGVASKHTAKTKSTKHGVTTVHYTVTVKDKAGNVKTVKGTYKIG